MDVTQRKDKDYYRFIDDLLLTMRNNALKKQDLKNIGKKVELEKIPYSGFFSAAEVGECYFKLTEDGFIRLNDQHDYVITIKGHLFVQDGMYKAKRRKETIKYYANIGNLIILCGAAIVGVAVGIQSLTKKDKPPTLIEQSQQFRESLKK